MPSRRPGIRRPGDIRPGAPVPVHGQPGSIVFYYPAIPGHTTNKTAEIEAAHKRNQIDPQLQDQLNTRPLFLYHKPNPTAGIEGRILLLRSLFQHKVFLHRWQQLGAGTAAPPSRNEILMLGNLPPCASCSIWVGFINLYIYIYIII